MLLQVVPDHACQVCGQSSGVSYSATASRSALRQSTRAAFHPQETAGSRCR
jgi:hypothetical protein